MRRTKIVCTLGPAVHSEEKLEALIRAGLNAARFNFSHGDHDEQFERLTLLRNAAKKVGVHVPCVLDTKGPEVRLGSFAEKVKLEVGQKFIITTEECACDATKACVSHKGLVDDVKVGDRILIDDGLVELVIDEINGQELNCTVLNQGVISSKKSVNIPNVKLSLPTLTPKDISDLKFACENEYDYIAASFVQSKEDVLEIKKYLKEFGRPEIKVISKIENQEGINNFDEILEVTDAIMVARGDLGVEVPMERLPMLQKQFIKKCIAAGKLVITATQMLDSMMKNPRPTRAEVSDVANAILDGTSCIMLSGETANGDYPIEAVTVMAKIAEETENQIDYSKPKYIPRLGQDKDMTDDATRRECINFSVYTTATIVNAKAIICVSEQGLSPRMLSQFRPQCPIYVITPNIQTVKHLSAEWGIKSVKVEPAAFDAMLSEGLHELVSSELLAKGDTVVLSGGATPDASNTGFASKEVLGGIIRI